MNILTGIFIEKALKLAQPDRERLALELRKDQLKQVNELTALVKNLDVDRSGTIGIGIELNIGPTQNRGQQHAGNQLWVVNARPVAVRRFAAGP